VPIALVDKTTQSSTGGIATLVFEAFSPGRGRLILHPEDSFCILPDDQFTDSLRTAWQLALNTAGKEPKREMPDVIWRVMKKSPSMPGLDENAYFVSIGLRWKQPIAGRSASGAAARAFHHLLKGTYPDPDVFVLAQVPSTLRPPHNLKVLVGSQPKSRPLLPQAAPPRSS